MSMRLVKGKQKIEMKKIESDGDRMITFSKRKSGIYKKLNEIVTMCDVKVAFLVFSEAGKPYTFAHPSMEEMANRFMNPSNYESFHEAGDNTKPLVEAYKKQKILNLMTKYVVVVEDFDIEKEKEKVLKIPKNDMELKKMWWNRSLENLKVNEIEKRHQTFTELYDSLCDLAISKLGIDDEGSS